MVSALLTPNTDAALEASTTLDVLIGRQPIYDRLNRVVAYELLNRGAPAERATATAQVMLNASAFLQWPAASAHSLI